VLQRYVLIISEVDPVDLAEWFGKRRQTTVTTRRHYNQAIDFIASSVR
jgi:hypothetical protein